METIECSKCGAIFEKTGAKDKLRRFKDKRFMTTFHCPNCDARVILKNGDEPISIYLKRLERLKEQARRLGDTQEANELQDEINQISKEMKMDAGKTKDKKFSMKDHGYVVNRIGSYEIIEGAGVDGGWWYAKERKGRPPLETKKFKTRREAEEHARMSDDYKNIDDAAYDPTKPKNIAKAKDSLFKGQKVTAIKSEQGLREGETYTVLGEEEIIKQIVGEGNAIVYKLQDSSGNVIVIENPEGLFYEVKDSKTKDENGYVAFYKGKRAEVYANTKYEAQLKAAKVLGAKKSYEVAIELAEKDGEQVTHKAVDEVKDSKTKDKYELVWQNSKFEIYEDENNEFELVRKSDKAIIGQYATIQGAKLDAQNSWQDDWKSGKLDNGTKDPEDENESLKVKIGDIRKNMDAARKMGYDTEPYQKEIDKLETKDDEELSGMLVNDAPDYYGAIVATARRGNNPRMGGAELRKNIESFMTSHGVQFNEEEFNKAYKEFSKAGVSKAAFMKGTDSYDFYTKGGADKKTKDAVALMECMECGHKFKKNLSSNTFEVKCPKCGGYDVEVISGDSKDSSDVYTKDPLTKKGEKILAAMKKVYGEEKGEQIFYASKNKGTISGVDSGAGLQGACGGERKFDGKGPRFGQDKKTKDALQEGDRVKINYGVKQAIKGQRPKPDTHEGVIRS